jgi:hypothetical protein
MSPFSEQAMETIISEQAMETILRTSLKDDEVFNARSVFAENESGAHRRLRELPTMAEAHADKTDLVRSVGG